MGTPGVGDSSSGEIVTRTRVSAEVSKALRLCSYDCLPVRYEFERIGCGSRERQKSRGTIITTTSEPRPTTLVQGLQPDQSTRHLPSHDVAGRQCLPRASLSASGPGSSASPTRVPTLCACRSERTQALRRRGGKVGASHGNNSIQGLLGPDLSTSHYRRTLVVSLSDQPEQQRQLARARTSQRRLDPLATIPPTVHPDHSPDGRDLGSVGRQVG